MDQKQLEAYKLVHGAIRTIKHNINKLHPISKAGLVKHTAEWLKQALEAEPKQAPLQDLQNKIINKVNATNITIPNPNAKKWPAGKLKQIPGSAVSSR